MYGMKGQTLGAVKEGSESCVRINKRKSEVFKANVALRQGCVMSSCLLTCIWIIKREVNAKIMNGGES